MEEVRKRIDLMVIGAQKAGTSTIINYLDQHPNVVCFNASSDLKNAGEYMFFVMDHLYEKGYDQSFKEEFGNKYDSWPQNKLLVAKNVAVMYEKQALERLYKHNPKIKLVIMLRNPIDRAYSAFWFAKKTGREHLDSFREALFADKSRFKGNVYIERSCAYLERSSYHKHIQNAFEIFGRENVKIVLLDDFKHDASGSLNQMLQMTGSIDDFPFDTSKRFNTASVAKNQWLAQVTAPGKHKNLGKLMPLHFKRKVRNFLKSVNNKNQKPAPISKDLREELINHFREENQKVGELIGRDLSIWNA
ncbi:MAG: sulfotransferase domain-containing protein [Flavobacteriales bacterium]|nr:sulfotransferase domain-containing protein [Flavobacteriales bacterium]